MLYDKIRGFMISDSLMQVSKSISSNDINWIQLIVQSFITIVVFGLILEFVRRKFTKELAFLKNEFSIIQASYNNNYKFIIEYYTNFHKHYRACQKVVNSDIIRYDENTEELTEEIFIRNIDDYVAALNEIEPKIRLIFPKNILEVHEDSISAFSRFKGVIKSYYKPGIETPKPKEDLAFEFRRIDLIKRDLESKLKSYLRTDKIYNV